MSSAVTENDHNSSVPLEYSTEEGRLKILGFWIFIGAEIVLFSCLFATYLVLLTHTAGGPDSQELYKVKEFMEETIILLVSSFTCGLATLALRNHNKVGVIIWLIITMLLGASFIYLEVHEFVTYATVEGATIQTSGFLSGFFILVGTHGAHVSLGLLWMGGIVLQLIFKGINPTTARKVFIVGLYWHFLDVVWVFIFTAVYLTGLVI